MDGGAYQIGKRWTEVHISESSLVVPTLCPQKQGLVSLSRRSYALTRNSSKNVFSACLDYIIKVGCKTIAVLATFIAKGPLGTS